MNVVLSNEIIDASRSLLFAHLLVPTPESARFNIDQYGYMTLACLCVYVLAYRVLHACMLIPFANTLADLLSV